MASDITFKSVPEGRQAEREQTAIVEVTAEEKDPNNDLRIEVVVELYKGSSTTGSPVDSRSSFIDENDTLTSALNVTFESPGDYQLSAKADLYYFDGPGYDKDIIDETITTSSSTFPIVAFEEGQDLTTGDVPRRSYENAYQDRASVRITNIVADDSVDLGYNTISFEPYDNPTISVSSSGRFATHEIIGGTTVRQKIGEDPTEISINGACDERTAAQVDDLRKVSLVDLVGGRFPSGITCQVAGSSTDPWEDGGAADLDQGNFIYEFNIELVEVSTTELQRSSDNFDEDIGT